jgi:hypothetical protein
MVVISFINSSNHRNNKHLDDHRRHSKILYRKNNGLFPRFRISILERASLLSPQNLLLQQINSSIHDPFVTSTTLISYVRLQIKEIRRRWILTIIRLYIVKRVLYHSLTRWETWRSWRKNATSHFLPWSWKYTC